MNAPATAPADNQHRGRPSGRGTGNSDLARHFMLCAREGRFLTLPDKKRFVITDDLRTRTLAPKVVTAAAAVFSRDALVAEMALIPLALRAGCLEGRHRAHFEELFSLIEGQALSMKTRSLAHDFVSAGFNAARIEALEKELSDTVTPARLRYREFLEVVHRHIDGRISMEGFYEEFLRFAHDVAGKLDFGIYSFCIDKIFGEERIDDRVKFTILEKLFTFPPLVRRELITNILAHPKMRKDFIAHVRTLIERELGEQVAMEMSLLAVMKTSGMGAEEMQRMFLHNATA